MVGKASIRVGDKFILTTGVEVEVIEYKSSSTILVKDTAGNTKTTNAHQLRTGKVSWREFGVYYFKHKQIKVGDSFKLKCGVVVFVKSCKGSQNIEVVDDEGYKKVVRSHNLRKGSCAWDNPRHKKELRLTPKRGFSYVYKATYKGDVVYIGKGVKKRYTHVYDGTSHVYELNRLHFSGERVEVTIVQDGLSTKQAEDLEKLEIKLHKPRFNVEFNCG